MPKFDKINNAALAGQNIPQLMYGYNVIYCSLLTSEIQACRLWKAMAGQNQYLYLCFFLQRRIILKMNIVQFSLVLIRIEFKA